MSHAIEHERTFLAKEMPPDLTTSEKKEIIDIFLPSDAPHPVLRIRKNGDKHEMTKKYPVAEGDSSVQHEFTVPLTKEEYEELASSVTGKRARKIRHQYLHEGIRFEVDVYQDDLKGLVIVDAEIEGGVGLHEIEMPPWCLADVTQEEFIAGGMLCGKRYEEIAPELARFGYKRL